jgi:hypothetical protein
MATSPGNGRFGGEKSQVTIERLPNWRVALYKYFDAIRHIPFDNDTNNCAQFIANGWLCVRPDDPFVKYRKYRTIETLLKAVKKDGYNSYADFFDGFLVAHDHVSQARIGDIAVFYTDQPDDVFGTAPGWVIGERVFVLRPTGLATIELSSAIKAFRV